MATNKDGKHKPDEKPGKSGTTKAAGGKQAGAKDQPKADKPATGGHARAGGPK